MVLSEDSSIMLSRPHSSFLCLPFPGSAQYSTSGYRTSPPELHSGAFRKDHPYDGFYLFLKQEGHASKQSRMTIHGQSKQGSGRGGNVKGWV